MAAGSCLREGRGGPLLARGWEGRGEGEHLPFITAAIMSTFEAPSNLRSLIPFCIMHVAGGYDLQNNITSLNYLNLM